MKKSSSCARCKPVRSVYTAPSALAVSARSTSRCDLAGTRAATLAHASTSETQRFGLQAGAMSGFGAGTRPAGEIVADVVFGLRVDGLIPVLADHERKPEAPAGCAADPQRMSGRVPDRRTPGGDETCRHDRTRALLRGAGRLLAVVVLAGAAGTLLGFGLAALTGDDASSSASPAATGAPAATTQTATTTTVTAATPTTTAAATTPASAAARLHVAVLSTIVHPVTARAGDTRRLARVSIHVRVTNSTGRRVTPARPVLLVDDARVQGSSEEARPLLAALDPGAVADGRLRFDTDGALTGRLTTARVRLRIAGRTVALTPVIGSTTALTG